MLEARNWRQNARDYYLLSVQGKDFRLALLAACSVNVGNKYRSPQKTTITDFAMAAKTTPERVTRHLKAWDYMASRRVVPALADMKPDQSVSFQITQQMHDEFYRIYDASDSGGRPRASVDEIVARAERDSDYLNRLLNTMDNATRTSALSNLLASVDPRTLNDLVYNSRNPVVKHLTAADNTPRPVEPTRPDIPPVVLVTVDNPGVISDPLGEMEPLSIIDGIQYHQWAEEALECLSMLNERLNLDAQIIRVEELSQVQMAMALVAEQVQVVDATVKRLFNLRHFQELTETQSVVGFNS